MTEAGRAAGIEFDRVSKVYPGSRRPAIDALSLAIPAGHIVTLVGPSGCGKTTALRLINRLTEPSAGRVQIGGVDSASLPAQELRLGIGYVIQQAGLFPHRTVASNIATVPRLLGWDRARIDRRIEELIDLIGLDPAMRDRYPSELSGGQQQRVGVARALAGDPPVLLMDEPFGAVDPIVRARLQDELLSLQQRVHKTVVFVTHDVDEAIKLGDQMAILNVGGVLEQIGPPEEVLRAPANPFVERFIGGERGLKRLGLMSLSQIELSEGCVLDAERSVDDALALMRAHGVDWIGVTRNGELLGWTERAELQRITRLGDARVRPFRVRLAPTSTLRHALDEIVTAATPVAVVTDGPRYLGMITLEDVRREVAR